MAHARCSKAISSFTAILALGLDPGLAVRELPFMTLALMGGGGGFVEKRTKERCSVNEVA